MSELVLGGRTVVMGIVNVTPDSFSGDGIALAGRPVGEVVAAAVAQARGFVEAGAEILDVGAASSRPAQFYGEHPGPSPEQEAALAVPVVAALVAAFGDRALISIDTATGSVARAALETGAGMVNDVWAGQRDPDTALAAAGAGAWMVLMHNRERAEYPRGLFDEVVDWMRTAVESAVDAGVAHQRIVVDPGIGFGKTVAHSIEMLHRLAEFKAALGGLPLLVGVSRKRFIGELLGGVPPSERLEGTAASVALAIASGADIVRVHDVASIMRTVRVADGIVRWRPGEG